MRLTLRTLLAFMDEILAPEDAEDIGRKIRESEFATSLLHRTRDVMRRLRLAVPQDPGPGGGQDPNAVAEYLDNTLADDRVPDFERTCLESDMHLAEVASCHQILTLVLGSPAEVDPATRERMYRIPDEAMKRSEDEMAAAGKLGAGPPELPSIQAAPGGRRKPTVPDYLREPSRPWWRPLRTVGLVVLGVLIVAVVFYATGQFEASRPMGKLLARLTGRSETAAAPSGTVAAKAQETGEAQAPAVITQPSPAAKPAVAVPSAAGTGVPSPEAAGRTNAESARPADAEAQPQPQAAESIPPKLPVGGEPLPSEAGEVVPPQPETAATPAREPTVTVPAAAPSAAEHPSPSDAAPSEVAPAAAQAEPAASPVEPVGRLTSEGDLLLEFDPETAAWTRVPAQGTVGANRQLLALPTFRPTIAMTAGTAIQLMGGAEVTLEPAGQRGIPGLDVMFGQAVVRTLGQPESKLWLQAGERGGTLTLADAEATLAIDVARPLGRGADPEKNPGPLTIDLYVVTGRVIWQEDGAKQGMSLAAPARLRVSQPSAQPDTAIGELPKWTLSESDRLASPILASSMTADRPISLSLQELADDRRKEVRVLAVRCLGYVGQFGPMVAALNDPDQKSTWPDYIAELQSGLARGPAVAAQVRQAMEKEYGAEAPKLFRMLWGFTEDELRKEGEGTKLVDDLDSELLACRVLAYWNLKEVTGLKIYYRAEAPAAQRQQGLQRWRQRIESDQAWKRSPRGKAPAPKAGGPAARPREEGSPPNGPPRVSEP